MSEDKERIAGTEQDQGGFKVDDRRQFTAQGDPIVSGVESAESVERKEDPPQPAQETSQEVEEQQPPAGEEGQSEVDFAGFLLSLATSAMAYLGEVPDPASGSTTENLPAAKQMIDILSILQVKTKGNLEPDEERLLDNLLYELRMKYLKKTQVVSL
jgi:hypothetical protein